MQDRLIQGSFVLMDARRLPVPSNYTGVARTSHICRVGCQSTEVYSVVFLAESKHHGPLVYYYTGIQHRGNAMSGTC